MVMPATAVSPPFLMSGEAIGVVARRATARGLEVDDFTLIFLCSDERYSDNFAEKSLECRSNWGRQSVAELPNAAQLIVG